MPFKMLIQLFTNFQGCSNFTQGQDSGYMNDEWLCFIPGLLRLTFTLYIHLLQKHFHSRDSYKTLYFKL